MKPFKTAANFLAPIRAANLIQLDVYTDTRNFIHIWLPENYGKSPNDCCTFDRSEDRHFFMDGDTQVNTLTRPGIFEIRGEVIPIENGVDLKLTISNLSDEPLPESIAGVCIQFAAAPSFTDTTLERYFYVHEDEITFAQPPYQDYDHGHAWFWGTLPNETHKHNPPAELGFIGLASRDGNWVIGHGWENGSSICGNCHPTIACIHADPLMPEIPPGETVSTKGVLYIMEGNPESCLERYRNEFLESTKST
ncbi:MAG: hypothetical protein HRT89_05965 [Lentisphaeria bacterium]|nr:hypothetical protein [Lentisphaeria bacterium]NQZ67598.1 hypothetical protein [Lentisphaeria bacterium]